MEKVRITCLLWGESTGHQWISLTKGQYCGKNLHTMMTLLPCVGKILGLALQHWVSNINSLWPSDAIWRQKSVSTLAQVMACCLTAPSHYMNQCWFITSKVQWCSSEGTYTWDITTISTKISFKIIFLRFYWNLRGTNELSFYVSLLYI